MSFSRDVFSAVKWSAVTEIVAKLIAPVSNIILARLLSPEAFGVVVTMTMVVSFSEIFMDAGFQKYLIQHEFNEENEKSQCFDVSFWTNLFLSVFILFVIALFSRPMSSLIGSPGMGNVLIVASFSIPFSALSSVQYAHFKRKMDFKSLFKVRIVSVLSPLLVTIPLAIYLRSYWALIVGTLVQSVMIAVVLYCVSDWKPRFFYSIERLNQMLSFSLWTVIESVSIWLTNYLDVFFVGMVLNNYYLGLYKTSIVFVGQIVGVVTSITTPVLFSVLSRLQSDRNEYERVFLLFQKTVASFVIPLGVSLFFYRNFITSLFFGEKWMEASYFIGIWGLSSAFMVVFSHCYSEMYRSLGIPKLSVLNQWIHIAILLPVVAYFVHYGFDTLCLYRTIARLSSIFVNLIIVYMVLRFSIKKMMKNVFPVFIATCAMFGVMWLTKVEMEYVIIPLLIGFLSYVIVLFSFKTERLAIMNFKKEFIR